MRERIKVKTITLAQYFREDKINISHIEKPYGEFSDPVVRIDRFENGKTTGLVEIPYENLEEVIEALHKAEDMCDSIPHNDVHGELKSNVGGGE
ncbi:hypothetical protein [Halarcobacter sp.]|uniref:hypothetical protein n=1 Tax=Halarcobacter sp. TaxID=2321133 RepID=UPI002AA61F9B|nr:hypothetical protein [Halarcobacter sp.]